MNDNRIYLPTKEETGEKLIRGFLTWDPLGNVTVIGKNGRKGGLQAGACNAEGRRYACPF